MKKIVLMLLVLMLILVGCYTIPDNGDDTGDDTGDTPEPPVGISTISAQQLNDSNLVKWQGRTYYDTSTQQMMLYNTATGFEVNFVGTSISATFTTTNTTQIDSYAKFAVMVDGQTPSQGIVITVNQSQQTIVLSDNLTNSSHTVKVYKASEGQDSINSIVNISCNGQFTHAPSVSDTKVLLVGGSGISGHGALGRSGARTTSNSSSLHSFGYLVARQLGADFQFVSNSGWGVKYGSNPTNNNGTVNLLTAIDYIGIDNTESIVDIPYDMAQFSADIVIVNAGGNDYTGYINQLSGTAKNKAILAFQQAVVDMIAKFRQANSNCIVIWTFTDAETGTASLNGRSAMQAISTIPDNQQYIFPTYIAQVGSYGDPTGAHNHASDITHQRNAAIVLDVIRQNNK